MAAIFSVQLPIAFRNYLDWLVPDLDPVLVLDKAESVGKGTTNLSQH